MMEMEYCSAMAGFVGQWCSNVRKVIGMWSVDVGMGEGGLANPTLGLVTMVYIGSEGERRKKVEIAKKTSQDQGDLKSRSYFFHQ